MNILLAMIFLVLGSTFMMVYNDPMIIIVLIFVILIYYRIQRFYRLTSRELRRLDSIYRSPVYTLFTDAMRGITELRSLGSASLIPYSSKLVIALNDSLRVSFAMNIASQWLNIRMQLLGTFITTMLALSIVLNAYYHLMPIAPGLAGLSLSYSFSIVNFLNGFINAFTETEQEMISVERVLEYSNLKSEFNDDEEEEGSEGGFGGGKQEKDKKGGGFFCGLCSSKKKKRSKSFSYQQVAFSETEEEEIVLNPSLTDSLLDSVESGTLSIQHPPSSTSYSSSSSISSPAKTQLYYNYIFSILKNHCFFQQDGIRFINVSMRYPSSSEEALKDLSFHIPIGSRIVIVGRTGSGKSSFLRLLLRLNTYHSGSILFNNICELKSISKQLLRKTVTILPQKPLLFTGDLRSNVDPLHLYSDEEIMIALYESSFLTTLRSISKEVEVTHSSSSSSSSSFGTTRAIHPFPSFPPSDLLKSSPLSIIAEVPEEEDDEDDDEDPEEASFFSSKLFSSLLPLSPLSRPSSTPSSPLPSTSPALPHRQVSKEKVIDWSIKGVDSTIHEILNFPIEESGNNLSWGQRQLICLARALLKKSDLILIDEISASLDQETKNLVFNSLERHLTRNPSTILLMISHHLEGIDQLCDTVSC
jgi:ABC-type multidrug transport system fused ATPase/permease subunit